MNDYEQLKQMMERPIRKHGLTLPLHPFQILTFLHMISSLVFNILFYNEIHIIIYTIFYTISLITGIYVTVQEPIFIQQDAIECMICGPVNGNSLHCKYCNKCIPKLDHHCFYLNTCIGLHNYKSYILSLISTILLSTTSIIWFCVRITMDSRLEFIICFCIEMIKNLFVLGFLVYLFGLHVYLIITKQTTLEYSRKIKVHSDDVESA